MTAVMQFEFSDVKAFVVRCDRSLMSIEAVA